MKINVTATATVETDEMFVTTDFSSLSQIEEIVSDALNDRFGWVAENITVRVIAADGPAWGVDAPEDQEAGVIN